VQRLKSAEAVVPPGATAAVEPVGGCLEALLAQFLRVRQRQDAATLAGRWRVEIGYRGGLVAEFA